MQLLRPILILFGMLCLFSCEKETIIEVAPTFSWSASDQFVNDRRLQLNTHSTADRLYMINQSYFTEVEPGQTAEASPTATSSVLWFNYPIQYKLPIADQVFAGFAGDNVLLTPTLNPVLGNTDLLVNIKSLVPDFSQFDFPSSSRGEAMIINNQNQLLVPYLRFSPDYPDNQVTDGRTRFVVVDFRVTDLQGSDFVELEQTAQFTIDDQQGFLRNMYAIEDHFMLTIGDNTYRVSPDLQVSRVLNQPLFVYFSQGAAHYGIDNNSLYRSTDQGASWRLLGQVDSNLLQVRFAEIDGEIIGYYLNQLFRLEVDNEELRITELDNDGLLGHQITSVALLEETVYVTTLSGVFTRPLDTFLSPKEEEE